MSRLRFPFLSQSTNQVNGSLSLVVKEPEPEIDLADWSKGKVKDTEKLWGLENFGNTCYCNSVLQALYACQPFRQFVESYPDAPLPISPLAPPPGTANEPKTPSFLPGVGPSSPLTMTRGNPFDNPALNGIATPASPSSNDKKEKRSWTSLGRKTSSVAPPSLASIQQGQAAQAPPPLTPPPQTPAVMLEEPPVPVDPNQAPPTVFETIQTLFSHLTSSPPHQPLAPKKVANANTETAQTASLLPAGAPVNGAPTPSLTTSSSTPAVPPGPPLLASLPPPSAPRGGGPWQAGQLGRGVVRPEDLLKTVKRENEMFRGMSQQDAHEFLGWVLNKVAEDVEVVDRSLRAVGKEVSWQKGYGKTFVQNLFEGVLTNETRCLSCESTSSRDELFLDLSIDIEQHTSVTSCLRQFSMSEMLCQKNKFHCDTCCGLQEAEKRMKIKRLPNVLALHLKRFKYQENLGRYTKLFYRVPFPLQLRLPNTADDTDDPDRLYELFACVIHIGNGPTHGHYVCLIRSGGRWVMCDDENIEPIQDNDIYRYFGDYPSGAGYVLFYQSVDLNLGDLGLKRPAVPPPTQPAATVVEVPNLMDIDEDHEAPLSPPLSKSPLTVQIPSSAVPGVVAQPPSPIAAKTATPVLTTPTRPAPPPSRASTSSRPPPPPPPERSNTATRAPPPPPPGTTPVKSPVPTTPAVLSPAKESAPPTPSPITNGSTLPEMRRTISPSVTSPTLGRSLTQDKDKDSKWYQRKKSGSEKDIKRSSVIGNPPPADSTTTTPTKLQRQGTSPSLNTLSSSATGSTTFAGLGVNVPSTLVGDSANGVHGVSTPISSPPPTQRTGQYQPANEVSPTNLSSSVMSSISSTTSTASPTPATIGLGRKPSTNEASLGRKPSTASNETSGLLGRNTSNSDRTRTTSASSQGSGPTGGLSRRLSGIKITRSESGVFKKLGFGKKDKGEMNGVQE